MRTRPARLEHVAGFSIDAVAAAADQNPDMLRLENLDTDLGPPAPAIAASRAAVGADSANSYLPFNGQLAARKAVAGRILARSGISYDPETEVVVTASDGDCLLDALLALSDPGDEVILTDPTYAGMLNRVRLAGGVPRLVPMAVRDREWRMDLDALRASVSPRTRAVFLQNPSFPSGYLLNDEEWSVAPAAVVPDLSVVHIYNGITPGGIAQAGLIAALEATDDGLADCVIEWQHRRDAVTAALEGYAMVPAAGCWSQIVDTVQHGAEPADVSRALLRHGVAATAMTGWGGEIANRHLRLVFSNEPVERLELLGERFRAAMSDVTHRNEMPG